MTLDAIKTELTKALEAGQIYNVDFVACKDSFGRLLYHASREAQGVYLAKRPGVGQYFGVKAIDDLYWFSPQANSFGKFNTLLEGAILTMRTEEERAVVIAYQGLYEAFAPVATLLKAAKQCVISGRKPTQAQVEHKALVKATEQTVAVLNKSLAAFRVLYRAAYVKAYQNKLVSLQRELDRNGGDIEKVQPYPASNQDRKSHAIQLAYYYWTRQVTVATKKNAAYRRSGEPQYVTIKQEAYAAEEKRAISDADASIDGYIQKLAVKIGKDATTAVYAGDLWYGSDLKVVCADGEKQLWHTKVILNISCLKTVFNQWPTRRVL